MEAKIKESRKEKRKAHAVLKSYGTLPLKKHYGKLDVQYLKIPESSQNVLKHLQSLMTLMATGRSLHSTTDGSLAKSTASALGQRHRQEE